MPNRLREETSPYLLQHADNPVDWHPWGEEALALARETDKPILLSIGYSACHWCHVMAHESFEDPATAEVMNTLFVNIKVDREERPDLDKIYQSAHQLLNRRPGGWPLTAFLAPDDHLPFFIGTYFPPRAAHGMPPFTEILQRVHDFYREHRADIDRQNTELAAVLRNMNPGGGDAAAGAELNTTPLDAARRQLEADSDRVHGGFGGAPKFPHPTSIERLLRHWAATRASTPDDTALQLARHTLHAMAAGGIYDQLGGGFCRYSVDAEWQIPHFEKMLYDNGPLLALYAEAHAATGEVTFARICDETAAWVMREMQSPEGGYYATLDADSEGEEGRFYAWTREEIAALLDEDELAVAERIYGLDGTPNFEGKWHLCVHASTDSVAAALGLDEDTVRERLHSARAKLFAARERRVRPGRDEKVLTAWNGLMIRGMAIAGRIFGRPDWIDSATRAVDFIRDTLLHDGRLHATCKDGRARLMGCLDDYAFVMDGLLELLQARWRDTDYALLTQLADSLLAHFEDREHGGFFFTAHDHEHLIQRPKPFSDDATPAGNAVAATVLARLGHINGETRFLAAAERTLRCAWPALQQFPHAHCGMLRALEEYCFPPTLLIIRGSDENELRTWLRAARQGYHPRRLALAVPDTARVSGLLAERRTDGGKPRAWWCSGTRCRAPVDSLDAFEEYLRKK